MCFFFFALILFFYFDLLSSFTAQNSAVEKERRKEFIDRALFLMEKKTHELANFIYNSNFVLLLLLIFVRHKLSNLFSETLHISFVKDVNCKWTTVSLNFHYS